MRGPLFFKISMKLVLSLFLLSMHLKVNGQSNRTIIPFELTSSNNIVIKSILNQKDTLNLMLHTGASDVTLTDLAIEKLKSISFEKSISGVKSWGGVSGEARVSEHNTLSIGSLTWDSISITENKFSGPSTDGKCGLDLFANQYVAFDFDKKIITITNDLPKKLKGYRRYSLEFDKGLLFLVANCEVAKDKLISHKFLVHSGYAGSILLDDKFTNDHNLAESLLIIGEKELKDSYGNIIKSQKAVLPSFHLGNKTLKDIPVGFFAGSLGRQKISSLGGDVIKRFNWVIDANRGFVYLKSNENFEAAYTNI
jgi:hypothetical protein